MLDAQDFHPQQTHTARTRPQWLQISRSDVLVGILLGLTLFAGLNLRMMGRNWDDFVRFHPDERYLTGQIAPALGGDLAGCYNDSQDCLNYMQRVNECRAKYPDTNGRGAFFDANCSPYNPENVALTQYVYGTLPVFIVKAAADFVADQTGDGNYLGYSGLFLVWRTISGLADTAVILLVFLIGARLYNKWVGLTAAVLYTFAVFPIQIAHFGTTDAITNLFVTLAIYLMVRLQDTDSLWDYGWFGAAVGAAVASRINVAPLAFVLVVPILLRMLPAFDGRIPTTERTRHLYNPLAGGVLAALVAMVVFRIGNPYAFMGPGFFGVSFNDRFFDALSQAQHMASVDSDWPPSWQWVNRTAYLFPLKDMVIWGMGFLLGLTAWLSTLWAGWRLVRGKPDSTRNIILFTWILGYFLFVGNLFVMSMRYYLPLYGPLFILAAWLLVSMVQGAFHRRNRLAQLGAIGAFGAVVGFTVLWGLMFSNIYRHQATFVQAGYYTWEQVPGDFYMEIDGAEDETPLINIAIRHGGSELPNLETQMRDNATRLLPGVPTSVTFWVVEGGQVDAVNAHRLVGVETQSFTDGTTGAVSQELINSDSTRTVRVSLFDTGGVKLAEGELSGILPAESHPLGESYVIPLNQSVTLDSQRQYIFNVEVTGGTVLASGAIMSSELPWDEAVPPKVCFPMPDGLTFADNPPSGLYSHQDCVNLGTPAPWEGLVHTFNMAPAGGDNDYQRERYQIIFDQSDYLWVNTNRRYDSQSRIPLRWPMTNAYYDALFSGELGFELEQVFQETFELGPIKVSDSHLPFYDSPDWLNEFEPEEAFSVYDHPVVMLFRKTEAYSSENTAMILNSTPLVRVDQVPRSWGDATITDMLGVTMAQADQAPTHLMFTPELESIQEQGGTWAERFNFNSILNQNQVLAVVFWWLVIVVFGWAAWPLLFVLFPALADRGYGFSKIIGLFLVAWSAWVLGTMRIPVWNQAGVLFGLLTLLALSGVIAWRTRERLIPYLRSRWGLLLTIEALSLLLFIGFLGVRLSNPDLWHNVYGGEKPMDFAYFNGVLRSTVFPAIDPWYADGYINYYYFGFVIVGAPTLLTGIIPSIAYNLILPTLFSVTGMGAFSLAFNLVASWRRTTTTADARREKRPIGNPYIAGVMALLLAVVLGNLDTVRVMGNEVAKLGGYVQPTGITDYLQVQRIEGFRDEFDRDPTPEEIRVLLQEAQAKAAEGKMLDRIEYEIHNTTSLISGLVGGIAKVLQGETPYIRPDRWFWAPTRVITEIPNQGDGAINEMPYFTFLYGDMHAHMISMPFMLFALSFVFHEVLIAGRDRRNAWSQGGALALGAIVVGLFQAINTWDYPTFMILSIVGLTYAWWLRWEQITRRAIINFVVRLGGFLAIAYFAALPFTWWFASGLTEFKIWDGKKTPLWAYLDIHGLFIFLVLSLLIWETARWMSAVKLRDLRGRLWILASILVVMFGIVALSFIMAAMDYQVALIVLPFVAWIALLFFRPGQSRAMQYVLVIAGLALCITLGTEFVTLRIDNGRQNSIFKFYIQAWLIFSVAGGAAFAWIVSNSANWRIRLAIPWYGFFGLLFFIAALFPITATRGKAAFRFASNVPVTLDGLEYMQYTSHVEATYCVDFAYACDPQNRQVGTVNFVHDYNMIRWLQDNVEGTPTIVEAVSLSLNYLWGGRISMNTGLPTVVGWEYHQSQQRSVSPLGDLVRQRVANVNAFYTLSSIEKAVEFLRYYDVRYIILSEYEWQRYGVNDGLGKFAQMEEQGLLTVAYTDGVAVIYEVQHDQLDQAFLAQLRAEGEVN